LYDISKEINAKWRCRVKLISSAMKSTAMPISPTIPNTPIKTRR